MSGKDARGTEQVRAGVVIVDSSKFIRVTVVIHIPYDTSYQLFSRLLRHHIIHQSITPPFSSAQDCLYRMDMMEGM